MGGIRRAEGGLRPGKVDGVLGKNVYEESVLNSGWAGAHLFASPSDWMLFSLIKFELNLLG